MNILQLILVSVRGLSLLTNNPALGGGSSLKLQETSEFLSMLGELLERGDEANEELEEFADVIAAMAKESRAPTPTEWQTLRDRSDAAHDAIQAAAKAAEEPEPEEEDFNVEEADVDELVDKAGELGIDAADWETIEELRTAVSEALEE
jgi:hypothetical protein